LQIVRDIITVFVTAIIIPLGLFVTLLIVRVISYVWFVALNRRPLPMVIHSLTSGNAQAEALQGLALDYAALQAWHNLPGMLRNYISVDPPLSRQLAPGVGSAASPTIPAATPWPPQRRWSDALIDLVLPQKRAAYNIYVTPQNSNVRLSANVMVVKAPEQWIEASRTFDAENIDELVLQIGGFCMECVQLQPPFLRRTPRWEHWGSRGGYALFRQALWFQDKKRYSEAYDSYEKASELSLGNIRLAVYRASLYELEENYDKAALIYDALHCLWKQNIEVAYRAAAARVNRAHQLFEERTRSSFDAGYFPEELAHATGKHKAGIAGEENTTRAGRPPPVKHRELELIGDAQRYLEKVNKDLRYAHVFWRWLKTWLPRRRDIGERRYWASWLRRDTFRQPLMLLRRSKRYEYLCAVKIALEANRLLEFLIRSKLDKGSAAFNVSSSFGAVSRLIRKKRIGWLANWTAACYFSRAAQSAEVKSPPESLWRKQESKVRMKWSVGLLAGAKAESWRQFCEEMAIGEIGRVLRNPCHQLNIELLTKDPDMKPLRDALKAGVVSVLIGPIGAIDPTLPQASERRGVERSLQDMKRDGRKRRPWWVIWR